MTAVALIASAQSDRAALRGLAGTGAFVYTLTREGILRVVDGPACDKIADVPTQGVVWCGIPSRWISSLGVLPFDEQTHIGSKARWGGIKDAKKAVEAVRALQTKLQTKQTVKAKRDEKAQIASARRAALFAPQPWFIPERLA
tara:strand:+ start:1434 stop:1862 length:429 start_codon:yes stop_codon:yes gene_type:complete